MNSGLVIKMAADAAVSTFSNFVDILQHFIEIGVNKILLDKY